MRLFRWSFLVLMLAILALTWVSTTRAFVVSPLHSASGIAPTTVLSMGLLDDVGQFMKRFTTKATASHILMRGGAEAANKLEDLKVHIADSPLKFAQFAEQYSECPSARNGGTLGEFGPGAMVKPFDAVVFNEEVGKVHGPVQTQFGYHLIYIQERRE